MSCCWSKKIFGRRSKREDCYKVKEDEEEKKEEQPEPPKYSWDRQEKVDANDFIIKDLHGAVLKKEGVDGAPIQIENCTDSTILFLNQASQLIIDECRHCTIVLGPVKGSLFIRDCSNCTILTSCGQLRTRDCTSVRIGILCPTEPIIENSNDVFFYPLAISYPGLKDQLHSADLRPFTNRVTSAHDFTPPGPGGKANFKVLGEPVKVSNETESILVSHGVSLSASSADFIPRFSDASDAEDPIFIFVLGAAEPVDELGDKAIELLRAVYTAEMKVQATHDVITKNIDSKMIPFAGKAERMILLEVSGNLAQLETDVEFDLISDNDMEPLQKLLIHLNGKKSG